MISDNYTDIEAESLFNLGYEACIMAELVEGDEVAMKEFASPYDEFQGTRIVFFVVRRITHSMTTYDGEPTGNCVVNIAAQFDRFSKPLSFGGTWGCYRKLR